jgi:hypothetical protein
VQCLLRRGLLRGRFALALAADEEGGEPDDEGVDPEHGHYVEVQVVARLDELEVDGVREAEEGELADGLDQAEQHQLPREDALVRQIEEAEELREAHRQGCL